MKVDFLDLTAQYKSLEDQIDQAIKKVLSKGKFILGEEVSKFEEDFARYCGTEYAVGVNSGTDALFLALKAIGISEGDEVIVPAFTFIASALAISYTGARPVFVDIDETTYTIDVNKIEKAITKRTKAIVVVHLYGQPADMQPLLKTARRYKLKVVEDAAQAHGAIYKIKNQKSKIKNLKVGSIGNIGCFSFYPTKNLGACGDGGMVITNDKKTYKRLLMLRDYGRSSRYKHIILGYNSRLDTLQAAVLGIKLRYLDRWNKMRQQNARLYNKLLKDLKNVVTPVVADYGTHIYHLYVIRVKNRDKIYRELLHSGISALIHYPIPLHLQRVYKELGYRLGDLPVAERVSREIISLPMYPYLKEAQIKFVVKIIKEALNK